MSAENVEIVRRGFEAYMRRDWAGAMEYFAKDAVWHPYLGQIGGGVKQGLEEIERMLRDIDVDLDLAVEADEFMDLGDDVLVPVRAHGTGKESGASVDAHWCQVWSLRGGRVVKVAAYPDREAALQAVRSADK
jgi:uncharacterized protein